MPDSPEKLAWHPAFCAAAELEFIENKNELDYVREYNLNKEPLRIDLLIRKKYTSDVPLKNEIGHIMKMYNVIEYKSPDDSMNIDDFFKTIGYASLFKSLGSRVDEVKTDEITVSMFREAYPRELFSKLRREKYIITENYPGIFYITGSLPFPVQIIVISRLAPETHSSLRVLSYKAQISDIERFILKVNKYTEQGDIKNAESILQVSGPANYDLFEKLKRRNPIMCDFLKELMKDYVEEELGKATEEKDRKIKEQSSTISKQLFTISELAAENAELKAQLAARG